MAAAYPPGVASGLLLLASSRIFWLGWFVLAPLCAAVYVSPPVAAALAGAAFGVLALASTYWGRYSFMPRSFLPLITIMNGVLCSVTFGLAALLWPNGAPAWAVLIFPVATVAAFAVPENQAGRLANPLLVPLERWLPADHNDLVAPVARPGGVLAVPTNDWRNFTEIHHRAAVWEAVETGVTVIRSAGHGTSSIYDPAGRVLGRASSFDGPVVLVADVPAPAAAQRAA
jgi:apolipoprotein N-acyltransferase